MSIAFNPSARPYSSSVDPSSLTPAAFYDLVHTSLSNSQTMETLRKKTEDWTKRPIMSTNHLYHLIWRALDCKMFTSIYAFMNFPEFSQLTYSDFDGLKGLVSGAYQTANSGSVRADASLLLARLTVCQSKK